MKNLFVYLLSLFVFTSCLHDGFDEPPVGGNGELPDVNTTISELKQLHQTGELIRILEDRVIGGVVIANDRSGNYYKTIVIQDATGGIDIKINSTGLFADLPIGQEVVIKCRDLYISDYNNLIQLGSVYDDNGILRLGGIEEVLINRHIYKGRHDQSPMVHTRTITELTDNDISTLIKLEGVQFTEEDKGQTYADAQRQFSLNRELEDCQENKIILRSSGYADFAGDLTPQGNGSITAVYSIYQSTPQLWIRDLNDVVMEDNRCNNGGGGGGGGGGTGTPLESLNENFESMSNDQDINMKDWSNFAVKGTRLWRAKVFDGNTYAQATAFNDSSPEMEVWMITPPIDLEKAANLQFESSKAFHTHDGLSVWISLDYEKDPTKASWIQLNARIATKSDPDHDWIGSGNIDLSSFSGVGHIGFKYVGNPSSGTTSYRIDNVIIN